MKKYIAYNQLPPHLLSNLISKIKQAQKEGVHIDAANISNYEFLLNPPKLSATTPKDVIWRKNKARLYRYISPHGLKYRTPILLLYAMINKAYILDLAPGFSFVENLVQQGYDVYLLDWGEYNWEDRDLGFGEIVLDYVERAATKLIQTSGTPDLSLLGYCQGGTIAALYASLTSRPIIKNVILMAAPIDFENAGISALLFQESQFDPDRVADTFKMVPKHFIDSAVNVYSGGAKYMNIYAKLMVMIEQGIPLEAWFVMERWLHDSVQFPGQAYRQWVKDFFQQNKLIKNELVLKGQKVDLARIEAPLLVMAGEKDHIVFPHQAAAALTHFSSVDKTYFQYPVSHVGLVVGKTAYPDLNQWLSRHS